MKTTVTIRVEVDRQSGVVGSGERRIEIDVDGRFTAPELARRLEGLIRSDRTWRSPGPQD